MALSQGFFIMIEENLYEKIYNISNLLLAYRKARKHKTKKPYVIEFEKDIIGNLFQLQKELIEQTYSPKIKSSLS